MEMEYKPLDIERIRKALEETIVSKIVYLERIDSTNEVAKRMIEDGSAKDGMLIIAEEQTKGKGRMGRRWISEKGKNLLFSLILMPFIKKDFVFALNMALSLSFIEEIGEEFGINAQIKWPNDIYIRGKKLSGILTEFFLERDLIRYAIVGMGINVNWSPKGKDLLYPTTSIAEEVGKEVEREPILIEGIKGFSNYYKDLLSGRIEELYKKWNERCAIIGKEVRVYDGEKEIKGTAIYIEKDGSLILLSDGKKIKILYGDVSLR